MPLLGYQVLLHSAHSGRRYLVPFDPYPSSETGVFSMSSTDPDDPYDELDALIREAMELSRSGAHSEPADVPRPGMPADGRGNVTPLFHRLPAAALQGYSRIRQQGA